MGKNNKVYEITPEKTTNVSQHVLMLRVDILNRYSDFHFVQTAIAFQKYGHRVSIVTCTQNPELYQNELNKIPVIETATWIPRNICGYFKYFMYVLRSFSQALRCVFYPLSPKPSVIFCNTSCIAIPILYFFGSCIIIHLQNPFELLEIYKPQYKCTAYLNRILKQSILCAKQVLVPDAISFRIFKKIFKNMGLPAIVTYPCVDINVMRITKTSDIRNLVPKLPPNGYLFMCFGEYSREYNLHLILSAFFIAVKKLSWNFAHKMHLTIAAKYDETDEEHRLYYKSLSNAINFSKYSQYITLLKHVTVADRKCLMYEATAVLHATSNEVFSATVLEAMFLGKTVIASNRSFARDVLVNEITGFLLPSDPEKFATVIQKLVINKILPMYIGNLAETEFKFRHSFSQYAKYLNTFVLTHCVNICCHHHCHKHKHIDHQ